MGTTQSKVQALKIPHQRFNKININHTKNIIESQIPIDFKKSDFQYWKAMIHQIKSDPKSNMLFLPLSYDQQMPSLTCNTSPKLKLTFPYFPYLLQQQIKNRNQNSQKNYFGEEQLWLLLYTLVKSQRAFSNLSLKVGDIHPHNIFINQMGIPRLACQFSWPNQKTNFQKIFIAPQQMKLCQMGQYPDICASNTSQAFSIGLTILSAGLLQNLEQICDLKYYQFNDNFLAKSLSTWQNLKFKNQNTGQFFSYSRQLKQIVKNLCRIKPQQRYLALKVYQLLKPYESKIQNIQIFNFTNNTINKDVQQTNNINDNNKIKNDDKNSYYAELFHKYSSSGRKQSQKQQLNFKNLQQIKKDLKLQFTESIHHSQKHQNNIQDQQVTSNIPPVFQYGNYQSLIKPGMSIKRTNSISKNFQPSYNNNLNTVNTNLTQNKIHNNIEYIGISNKFYQPLPINTQDKKYITTNTRDIQSYQIKQIHNQLHNQDFRVKGLQSDFLQRLQKQIQESKKSFP